MFNRTQIPLAIVLLLWLGACTPAATPVPPTPTETPQPEPTRDPARYYNEEGQFSLLLPNGWKVLDPIPVVNDPERPYSSYLLGPNPTPNSGPGNSIIAISDANLWTPEHFVQAQCNTCPAHPFNQVTLGGKPAWETQVGGGDVPILVTWHFIKHNGRFIALSIHDPETLEPLDDVIQSIQFLDD